jgi:probable LLM family oxidoreductase
VEFGVYNFGEIARDADTGHVISPQQRMRNLLEEIELADSVGLDVFGVGEHHRSDYVVSSPAVVLAAAAARTERIRLSSAVSVIGTDDPVRVFQDFATLDLISGGRAEIMAGKGGFTESFPLFGFDLSDGDALFEEKLELLLQLREPERVSWSGNHRPAIDNLGVYPRPAQDQLPIWVASTGNPRSAARAGALGLPLALGLLHKPDRLRVAARAHRRAAGLAGHRPPSFAVSGHGYIAESTDAAMAESFEPFSVTVNPKLKDLGQETFTRRDFEAGCRIDGATFIGSPDDIIEKILYQHEIFEHDRVLLHFAIGSLGHEGVMRSMELFATEVVPAVCRALGEDARAVSQEPNATYDLDGSTT